MLKLNPAQQQAVDTIEGPVMVIAGPGTGKTQVLASRVAQILEQTDTLPGTILALTFTDIAAHNMRQRLVKIIGKDAYFVKITTFHSFCSEVIQTHPEYFPLTLQAQPLTELEKLQLMEELILHTQLDDLKPLKAQLYYLKAIISAISNLKRENISPEKLSQILQTEQDYLETADLTKTETNKLKKLIAKNKELIVLYQKYQQKLQDLQKYDFEDMISLVIAAFEEHPELLLEYQEEIHYFLVDEYQDTNAAQNKVLTQLTSFWGEQANIFVVGDPHQSIFRFQGASVENALSFIDHYPQAKIITLQTGYRCPQPIYNAAHTLITENHLTTADSIQPTLNPKRQVLIKELNKKIETNKNHQHKQPLELTVLPDHTSELLYTAEKIKELHQKGVDYNQIAVLFRNNKEGQELQEVLSKWSIPAHTSTGHNILESLEITQLLNLFTLIENLNQPEIDQLMFEVLNYEWLNLEKLEVMKLTRQAAQSKSPLLTVLQQANEKDFKQLKEFLNKLQAWHTQQFNLVFTEFFEVIIKESGFLEYLKAANLEKLLETNTLYDQIKSWVNQNHNFKIRDLLLNIETMQTQNISLPLNELLKPEQSVTLSTVHSAKGMEWDHVFILNLVDKHWGNKRNRELLPLPSGVLKNTDLDQKDAQEDERRLFYVAVTRAAQQLHLTYAQSKLVNQRTKEQAGSIFLEELNLNTDRITHLEESEIDQSLIKLISPAEEAIDFSEQEAEFLRELAQDFVLSPTALNTYLRDPQEFLENNLLKVPRAKAAHMSFGTAVHAALEKMYRDWIEKQQFPDLKTTQYIFEKSLQREPLIEQDYERWLEKGKQILESYYQHFAQTKPQTMSVEEFFGGHSRPVVLNENILLSGRIDRVEWLDKNQKTVRVVDYKTGSSKSKNYIEGKLASMKLSERELALPETIRGPYKRQLLFYKLLTELDKKFPYQVEQGEFVFVEPTKSGKIQSHNFELNSQAINDLKDLITEVMTEIRELKFLSIKNH
jgi:DNA helicase-2/ATP-dependent DNA helicase PcrA